MTGFIVPFLIGLVALVVAFMSAAMLVTLAAAITRHPVNRHRHPTLNAVMFLGTGAWAAVLLSAVVLAGIGFVYLVGRAVLWFV